MKRNPHTHIEGEYELYREIDLTDEEMEEDVDDGSVVSAEKKFCNYYSELSCQYDQHFKSLLKTVKLSLAGSSITKAIICRLKTYYETQDEIIRFLDKKSVAPASDFFVETVLFYLRLVLNQSGSTLKAMSEVRFDTENGYIKPDISIWKENKMVAIIECKTNLGFARKRWENDFLRREKELKTIFSKAKAYLLVLSSKNWPGFDSEDKRVGKQFFALSKISIRKIEDTPLDDVVLNRVEELFAQIIKI